MVTEVKEAGWARILGHHIGDEFVATLVYWGDLTSFEKVADVM